MSPLPPLLLRDLARENVALGGRDKHDHVVSAVLPALMHPVAQGLKAEEGEGESEVCGKEGVIPAQTPPSIRRAIYRQIGCHRGGLP